MKTRCKDGFAEFVEFLKYAVESANDPVYGKEVLNKKGNRQMAPPQSNKGSPSFKSKANSLVTGLDTVPNTGPGLQTKTSVHRDVPCAKSDMTWKIVIPIRKSL